MVYDGCDAGKREREGENGGEEATEMEIIMIIGMYALSVSISIHAVRDCGVAEILACQFCRYYSTT